MKKYCLYFVLLLLILFSCDNKEQEIKEKKPDQVTIKKHLERANKYLVKAEEQNIRDFINRHGYNMQETGSGLFYEIYKKTNGEQASKGKIASISFKMYLLDGQLIYSSETDGILEFLIGKGGVESGLEEGVLLLKEGEKARFIIPSHLAHGLIGDLNKIPEKATIIYDLELIRLKDKIEKK